MAPFHIIIYYQRNDYRLELAEELSETLGWNVPKNEALKRLEKAQEEGIVRHHHSELYLKAIDILTARPYDLYPTIEASQFLITTGIIQVFRFQTWTN